MEPSAIAPDIPPPRSRALTCKTQHYIRQRPDVAFRRRPTTSYAKPDMVSNTPRSRPRRNESQPELPTGSHPWTTSHFHFGGSQTPSRGICQLCRWLCAVTPRGRCQPSASSPKPTPMDPNACRPKSRPVGKVQCAAAQAVLAMKSRPDPFSSHVPIFHFLLASPPCGRTRPAGQINAQHSPGSKHPGPTQSTIIPFSTFRLSPCFLSFT